jgi:predicted amidohydrolase
MIKIATVQGAPKCLDLTGTLGKMKPILEDAADNGCQLIAFPEAYIPRYPYWVWLDQPCVEKTVPGTLSKLCADSRFGHHGAFAEGERNDRTRR